MTEDRRPLVAQLERHEGYRKSAYKDSEGYLTIGIGRLIDERKDAGLSREEAEYLLRNDIEAKEKDLDQVIPWWRKLSKIRRMALVNMAFNLGVHGLSQFTSMLGALQDGDYAGAASEALNSLWAEQVGYRAEEIAGMLETDVLPKS